MMAHQLFYQCYLLIAVYFSFMIVPLVGVDKYTIPLSEVVFVFFLQTLVVLWQIVLPAVPVQSIDGIRDILPNQRFLLPKNPLGRFFIIQYRFYSI